MGNIVCNSDVIYCDACNFCIAISKRQPKNNPLYCPACGEPLYLEEEETGRQLNCHWAVLTAKARIVGDIFNVDRFADEAQHNRWKNFEGRHSAEEIQAAANAIRAQIAKSAKGIGSSCFTQVIARLEKAGGKASATVPQQKEKEYVIRYVSN